MEPTYLVMFYKQNLPHFSETQREKRQRILLALTRAEAEEQRIISDLHHQMLLSLNLSDAGDPFTFAKLLQNACEGWLLPREFESWLLPQKCEARRFIEPIIMELFLARLPEQTAGWTRYQQPATLIEAAYLASKHLTCHNVSFLI
ncbi:hypothetical protein C0J50_6183 [Silurus asotus]|uniref:SCAN box domain-containing protein n=1 Tax=Silurus asotus TaxID=30991 RepID=A0AAD5A3R4_SILAS|nr:hypothetical protein C0J50_6183 [Silurus asotus]